MKTIEGDLNSTHFKARLEKVDPYVSMTETYSVETSGADNGPSEQTFSIPLYPEWLDDAWAHAKNDEERALVEAEIESVRRHALEAVILNRVGNC